VPYIFQFVFVEVYFVLCVVISFIVSFSFYQPKPENDGQRVQDFFLSMEVAIRNHPLWATATEEDIDCAMEVRLHLNTYMSLCM